jgi:hypothetical protein
MYVDCVTISNKETHRETPIIKGWTTEMLREREDKEISLGGFGRGYPRLPPQPPQKDAGMIGHDVPLLQPMLPMPQPAQPDQPAQSPDFGVFEADSLKVFIEDHLKDAEIIALHVRRFLQRIQDAPKHFVANSIVQKVSMEIETMMKMKSHEESPHIQQNTQSSFEDVEDASQQEFWAQAVKVMEEISKTKKVTQSYDLPSFSLGLSQEDFWKDVNDVVKDVNDMPVDKENDMPVDKEKEREMDVLQDQEPIQVPLEKEKERVQDQEPANKTVTFLEEPIQDVNKTVQDPKKPQEGSLSTEVP